jgi:phage tail-like protein
MKSEAIESLLPEVFRRTAHEGGVLQALLEVMAGLHQPSEQVLDDVDRFFDPYRAPDAMVPVLASWVDLDRFFPDYARTDAAACPETRELSPGVGRLRELVAAAIELSQWRGTRRGLTRFLEVATGVHDFQIDEQVADGGGEPIPFHIRVLAPAAAAPHRSLIERILDQEKPAYVTYELEFGA